MLAEKQMQLSLPLFCKGLPDLKKVVVIPYARSKQDTDLSKIPNRCVMIMQNAQVNWLKPILTVNAVFCAENVDFDRFLHRQPSSTFSAYLSTTSWLPAATSWISCPSWSSSSFRSAIRCSSCIPLAPRALRNAWSTLLGWETRRLPRRAWYEVNWTFQLGVPVDLRSFFCFTFQRQNSEHRDLRELRHPFVQCYVASSATRWQQGSTRCD